MVQDYVPQVMVPQVTVQDYVLQVSEGVYMGSNGGFAGSPPEGVPVLPATKYQLPIDPKKVKDALNSIAEAVKSITDPNDSTILLLRRLGITGELLKALKDFGKVSASLAKFVPYVQAVSALLDFFGLFGKDEELSPALKQRFEQINKLIIAQDRKWTEIASAGFENPVLTHLDSVRAYARNLKQYDEIPPAAANWVVLDKELSDKLDAAEGSVLNALKGFLVPALWQSHYTGRDPDNPNGTWDPLRPFNLVVQDDAGNWQGAPTEPIGIVLRFDHRAMCYLVPALVQSYLVTIKLLLPEYRSTGRFRSHLASLLDKVEDLLAETRQNLTRSQFSTFDFANPLWLPPGYLGLPFPPPHPRFDVGAYDLAAARNYSQDQFEGPPPGIGDTSDKVVENRAVAYNWPSGADYRTDGTRDAVGWYKWDLFNAVECVKGLNDASAGRFGSLLYSSGYLQLAQAAALLKHLCTAPEKSETVMAGFQTSTKTGEKTTVEVESKAVIPFDPIKKEVPRIARSVVVTARLLMQSPVRSTVAPLTYKVYLRTLPGRKSDCRSDYSSVYWTDRKRIQVEPGNPAKAYDSLECSYTGSALDEVTGLWTAIVDEHLLVKDRTPRVVKSGASRISLAVDTFDIWVPVPDVPVLQTKVIKGIELATAGDSQAGYITTINELVSKYVQSEPPSAGDDVDITAPPQPNLGGPPPADPGSERRNLKRDQVSLQYEWTWNGPVLEIRIEAESSVKIGEPDVRRPNPNADVYLVVEEKIVDAAPVPDPDDPGEWRHSAFRIPFATQLTYVPQSFLNAEEEESSKADKFWRGLVSKYVEVTELSPEDPIAQYGRVSLSNAEQRMTLQAMVERHAPEFLADYTREFQARNVRRG